MTILETIESVSNEVDLKTFSFASLEELNSFLDSFSFSDYPINVVVPFNVNGTIGDIQVKETIPLVGWVLCRIDQDTVNVRSKEAEKLYINPMRVIAKRFIIATTKTDLTDPEVKSISYGIRPEYRFLSAHLFGVGYNLNWPISGDCLC